MTIRSKFLLIIGLALLLPGVGLSFALTMRPVQRFNSSRDNELKMAATLAGQIYKHQEADVLEGATEAAQQIGAFALVEQLAVMQPIPGASSSPDNASLNQIQRETPLKTFNVLATALQQKYHFDFLVLADTDGKAITSANPTPGLDDEIKRNDLFNEIKKTHSARVASVEFSSQAVQLFLSDKAKLGQTGVFERPENCLVIEAVAPVLRVQGELLGVVLAGHIVNDSKTVVSTAKAEVSRAHNLGADISIVFQNHTIATTTDGVAKGQRTGIDPSFSKSSEPSVRSFNLGGRRVVSGFYPISYTIKGNNTVIAMVMVTQPLDLLTDIVSTVGWPAIYGLSATFVFTLLVVFILTSRLTKALRRVNTDIIRIGLGDFDDPIGAPSRRDEAGDLVESLERLRVTIKQAIERLRRHT